VLCFCPDGTILVAFINCPGSLHDSQIADYGNIYNKLQYVYEGMAQNALWTLRSVMLHANI
jgi:hypothetical protein